MLDQILGLFTLKNMAIALFLLMYVLLLVLPKVRAYIACGTAVLFIIIGVLPIGQLFDLNVVDWNNIVNVIFMIAGTMGIVYLFIESKMPSLLADMIIEKTPNVKWAIVSLALFAGIISAFVDNVATVLMVAPVAIMIAKKLNISPVPSIIGIAISANLQGAATLVGDTTSIMLGARAGMNFADFFWYQSRPGLFFVVQAGALSAIMILLYLFRKEKQPVSVTEKTVVTDYFPSFLLLGTVVLLIVASFIPLPSSISPIINGLICMALFVIGIVREFAKTNSVKIFKTAVQVLDYTTLFLLFGLFLVIAGITKVGLVDDLANLFTKISDNPFVIFTLIVWASVLFSAFIDNIPYVATMLPIVGLLASKVGVPAELLYFGLLTGATLGGNLTPIGASANITALGILRKEGHEVSAGTFMKISVPFTLTAVTVGYILIWFLWNH